MGSGKTSEINGTTQQRSDVSIFLIGAAGAVSQVLGRGKNRPSARYFILERCVVVMRIPGGVPGKPRRIALRHLQDGCDLVSGAESLVRIQA